ncbi:hypothetical protein SCATT_p07550 (plasmid) [Streptantibioticus cattleyicolor NRRL 8057 = DSM 46488]|uniref:Uncharacterized protein n=1 Tax=Streptantibioticus cattleyicolor (strain ATCC 35852 / DSM 46488 / JCM 4925 / NBRC 14057 / NRRL 8057) TaxID=1003195 RepID=G8XHT4_STREN|nr:hypothetical protein SCATT_p07550 [Streptantibioticus cattleyicolor NRRL 8057 = DSM 46488]
MVMSDRYRPLRNRPWTSRVRCPHCGDTPLGGARPYLARHP